MSDFKETIILTIVYGITIIILSQTDLFFDGLILFVFSILYYGLMCIHIADLFDYKYILYSDNRGYHAKMIEPSVLLIPWKSSIEKNYHSYETQNLFGAKGTGVYSTEIVFQTEGGARNAIDQRKRKIKKNRKDFFKTPEKTNNNKKNIKV